MTHDDIVDILLDNLYIDNFSEHGFDDEPDREETRRQLRGLDEAAENIFAWAEEYAQHYNQRPLDASVIARHSLRQEIYATIKNADENFEDENPTGEYAPDEYLATITDKIVELLVRKGVTDD